MVSITALLTLAASIAITAASPVPAGAPEPKSVDNCNITSVYPSYSGWGLGYKPKDTVMDTNLLYSYRLNEEYQLQYSEEILLEDCLEDCAGYGTANTCQGVHLGYMVPDEGSTAAPASQQVGCFLFNRPLTGNDFAPPPVNGTWTYPKSVNLYCPS
ncbi:MAG: hypothetical protein M1834_007515 [Cirrosporium novae-zelandiae]|nr:MAG: hypothetical protein M1834_007515 [Cirrosporium novae-zelandiae]